MKNPEESEVFAITEDQHFNFRCAPNVPCFNACCRDLNQYLSPYDVLRLKRNLDISSAVFLEMYTLRHDGPRSGLPVVTLRPQSAPELKCPFVTSRGCGVYADRPASCRTYPVMRMAGRDRVTGNIREEYLLLHEPHCRGFETDRKLTVRDYMEEQGLLPYNAANDDFLRILGAKQHKHPGMLPEDVSDRIYTALYDSDRFIAEMVGAGSENGVGMSSYISSHISTDQDDGALLQAAYDYVIGCLDP